jgi:hypothetical protein
VLLVGAACAPRSTLGADRPKVVILGFDGADAKLVSQ